MPRFSLWFVVVAVAGAALFSLSTGAVAQQPVCSQNCATPAPPAATVSVTPTSVQQTRDQIAAVAQQLGLVTQDTSLAPDAKAQQINSLAIQFNQLVSQLPPSDCGAACPQTPAGALMATPTSAQQTRDAIIAATQQVDQIARDATLSQDAKVQQIDALVAQINQGVRQLQQLDCGLACPQTPTSLAAAPTPVPLAALSGSPTNASTPAAVATPGLPPTSTSQAREQLAAVAQKLGQVTQDASLSPDAKAQQINALAIQFNQLVNQVQQQGP